MSFGKNEAYSYYLFDSTDSQLGPRQFYKADSFDVYYKGTFKQGFYFADVFGSGYVKSETKKSFIKLVIDEIEKKRLERNKRARERRQKQKENYERLSQEAERETLPEPAGTDYILYDSQSRKIPKSRLSKAKFFSTFYQGKIKDRKLPLSLRWPVSVKERVILERLSSLAPFVEEEEAEEIFTIDTRRRFTCLPDVEKTIETRDGDKKDIIKRHCFFRKDSRLDLDIQEVAQTRKNLRILAHDLLKAFEQFRRDNKNTEQIYSFRIITPYFDRNGNLVEKFESDTTDSTDRSKLFIKEGKTMRVDDVKSMNHIGFGNSRTRITTMSYAEKVINRMIFGDERVTNQFLERRLENYMNMNQEADLAVAIGFVIEVIKEEE